MQHGTKNTQTKALKLTRQAAGILAKVTEMVEANAYCPDVLQQVDAVIGCLTSAKRELLTGHLDHCLHGKMLENKEKTVKELLKIYNLTR